MPKVTIFLRYPEIVTDFILQCVQIDFDANDRDYDPDDRLKFWESMRPWFLQQGYTLYRYDYEWDGEPLDYVASTSPQLVFEGEVQHPYSFFGGDDSELRSPPLNNNVNVWTELAPMQR
jgi:hypothetical protein